MSTPAFSCSIRLKLHESISEKGFKCYIMQVYGVAKFLAVHLLISRFIPSHIRPLRHTQCSCLFPHINAFLSFLSPWMKISWLPERGHWTFPQCSLRREREEEEKKSLLTLENGRVHSVIAYNRADKHSVCCEYTVMLSRKLDFVRMIIASPSARFQNDLMLHSGWRSFVVHFTTSALSLWKLLPVPHWVLLCLPTR